MTTTSTPTNVLVVDDDADVRWMLKRYLEKNNFRIEVAEHGEDMRRLYARHAFSLIVMDINMPGEDGLTLARWLRVDGYTQGIIMLTAATDTADRVMGLELGADDYVVKPFEPRELLARMKSVLRRIRPSEPGTGRSVQFGLCKLNLEERSLVDENGSQIAITSMEYDLLKAFAENPRRTLSRDQLLNLAHNRDWDPYDRSIDVRIARLRKKIEHNPSKPSVLKTVRGVGYMFVPE